MSTSPDKTDVPETPPSNTTVILLLGTIADTTWRMFVPVILGTVGGMWLDSGWHSQPVMSIAGLLLGAAITAVLIRQQLRNVK